MLQTTLAVAASGSPTGRSATGPVGRNLWNATGGKAPAHATVPTAAFWPYPHPGARSRASSRTRELAPSAPTTKDARTVVMRAAEDEGEDEESGFVGPFAAASPSVAKSTSASAPSRSAPSRKASRRHPAAVSTPSSAARSARAACTTRFSTTQPSSSSPSSAASYRTWPGKDASQTCIASNARARRVLATRSHAPRDRRKAAEEGVTVLTRASTPRRGASRNAGGGAGDRSARSTERCAVLGDALSAHASAVPTTPPPTTHTSTARARADDPGGDPEGAGARDEAPNARGRASAPGDAASKRARRREERDDIPPTPERRPRVSGGGGGDPERASDRRGRDETSSSSPSSLYCSARIADCNFQL